ncbi:MAG: SCO family protein [Acidobacteria bacterium]|nr:SCO family protein [Acidobacteriota bacterium]
MTKHSLAAALLLTIACSQPPPLEVLGKVPDFKLVSQSGESFDSIEHLNGHIWVACFIFTNCKGPCPRMSNQMKQVQLATEDLPDLRLVSFTVDPERDTPEVLAGYAKRYDAGPRWFFLTGPQAKLHLLKRYAFLLGSVDGELNHSTRFALVDPASQIRAFYDTSDPGSVKKLIADIRRLKKEPK